MREIDDGLVWRMAALGKEQIGDNTLLAVGGVERDALAHPIRGARIPFLHGWAQRRSVVLIEPPVDLEDPIRNRPFLRVITKDGLDGTLRCREVRIRCDILDEAEPVSRRAVEGRLRVGLVERVDGVIPAAAEDVALPARFVPAPLPRVTGHVVRAEGP